MTTTQRKRIKTTKYHDFSTHSNTETTVHHGPLFKRSTKTKKWIHRYFILGTKYLHYYGDKESCLNQATCKGFIQVGDVVSVYPVSDTVFEVNLGFDILTARINEKDDMGYWIRGFMIVQWLNCLDNDIPYTNSQMVLVHFGQNLVNTFSELGNIFLHIEIEVPFRLEGLLKTIDSLKYIIFACMDKAIEYIEAPRSKLFEDFKDSVPQMKKVLLQMENFNKSIGHTLPSTTSSDLEQVIKSFMYTLNSFKIQQSAKPQVSVTQSNKFTSDSLFGKLHIKYREDILDKLELTHDIGRNHRSSSLYLANDYLTYMIVDPSYQRKQENLKEKNGGIFMKVNPSTENGQENVISLESELLDQHNKEVSSRSKLLEKHTRDRALQKSTSTIEEELLALSQNLPGFTEELEQIRLDFSNLNFTNKCRLAVKESMQASNYSIISCVKL
eukprot:TRINITY_DN5258_c0_g1_i3.p1 TRINITY_DN5258_c0_g1~~TRINITY_DN5258_c0_g1_i3.p1  ORF type:complete len:442 (-),score=76.24 TRINITY_DN5258_c0_g1_i3:46-1371(-)